MKRSCSLILLVVALLLGVMASNCYAANKSDVIRIKEENKNAPAVNRKQLQQAFQRMGKLQAHRRSAGTPRTGPSLMATNLAQKDRSLLLVNRPDAKVYTHLKRGVIGVQPQSGQKVLAQAKTAEKCGDVVMRYVENNPTIFGMKSPQTELVLTRSNDDQLGMTHQFYQQQYAGIKFWGRQLVAHLDKDSALKSINCLIEPTVEGLTTEPAIPAKQAVQIAKDRLEADGKPMQLSTEQAAGLGFSPPAGELYYWQKSPRAKVELVWVVELRPNARDWYRFFISATTGEVLEYYNATNYATGPTTAQANLVDGQSVTLNTYEFDGIYHLLDASRAMFVAGQTTDQLKNDPQGAVWTLDLRNADLNNQASFYYVQSDNNTWPTEEFNSAHYYTGQVYDFYYNLNNINRSSFDNKGSTMLTVTRVGSGGEPMDNAFWNGSFVSMGDGKTAFSSLAGSLDIIAHEYTHAHVQYTANLEYKFQSGALNETYADIGGVALDNEDFLLAEDVVNTQYFPSGALRNMADPNNGGSGPDDYTWQPAHMDEYQDMTIDEDNGGVHVNGGITNFAAYKIMNSLGRSDGEQVLYRALVNYLTTQSTFADFRIAAVQSAGDLFGADSTEQDKVKQAFDEVGIVAGTGTEPPEDIPIVDGMQYILMVYDIIGDNSLLITNGFTDTSELSTVYYLTHTQVNVLSGRPVAVDPYGQEILFVDDWYNVRSILPDGSSEMVALDTQEWWSVAISPSGNKVALTRNVAENIIYLFDLDAMEIRQLPLLHPTTDHSNEYADVVDYADTLVFLDDQLLVYDCYNTVQSPGEGELSFWDVNMINVDSEKIYAVLPPQPTGTSVGNPYFASTNKNVLYVEIFDDAGTFSEIWGVNLSTGESGMVVDNEGELGFPDNSINDEYMLYTRTDVAGDGLKDIYRVPLADSKIASTGNGLPWFNTAQLPLWFVQGTPPTASVAFSATASSGGEDVATVNIPVMLSEASDSEITIDYAVTGGNAIGEGVDYTLAAGRLTFAAQTTSQNIVLSVVDDTKVEANEKITITLSRPVNVWLGDKTTHTYTIIDNDTGQTIPGDLTGDDQVDPMDLYQLISAWQGKMDASEGDANQDSSLDYRDLLYLGVNWLP